MSRIDNDIAKLEMLNKKLSVLLATGHPGLHTWVEMVVDTVEDMYKIVNPTEEKKTEGTV